MVDYYQKRYQEDLGNHILGYMAVTYFVCIAFRNSGYIKTPTRVIGTYYFDEFLWSHPWFRLPPPIEFQSLLLCLPGNTRNIHVPQASTLDGVEESVGSIEGYDAPVVHSGGHILARDEESGQLTNLKVAEYTEHVHKLKAV